MSFKYNKKNRGIKRCFFKHRKKVNGFQFLGHNGSGKSTLAKLLIGLLTQDSGEILIDGILLSEETVNDVRKKLGLFSKNPDNQFVGVTVRYDIAFGLENKELDSKTMEEF